MSSGSIPVWLEKVFHHASQLLHSAELIQEQLLGDEPEPRYWPSEDSELDDGIAWCMASLQELTDLIESDDYHAEYIPSDLIAEANRLRKRASRPFSVQWCFMSIKAQSAYEFAESFAVLLYQAIQSGNDLSKDAADRNGGRLAFRQGCISIAVMGIDFQHVQKELRLETRLIAREIATGRAWIERALPEVEQQVRDEPLCENDRIAYECIKEHPNGIIAKEIAAETGIELGTLNSYCLKRLRNRGYIKNKRGAGYYASEK